MDFQLYLQKVKLPVLIEIFTLRSARWVPEVPPCIGVMIQGGYNLAFLLCPFMPGVYPGIKKTMLHRYGHSKS